MRFHDTRYAFNLLRTALDEMTWSRGDVRMRLVAAYESHLHPISPDDFPESLRNEWEEIRKLMTMKAPLKDHRGDVLYGSVRETLMSKRNKTVEKLVQRIITFAYDVEAYLADAEREE